MHKGQQKNSLRAKKLRQGTREAMRPTVYLAGPITGRTETQAKTWRQECVARLRDAGARVLDPLRSEPADPGSTYETSYERRWGIPAHIRTKNRFDVAACDIVLAYLPEHPEHPGVVSLGTAIELGWAEQAGKTIFVVAEAATLRAHPLLPGVVLSTLDEAVQMIAELVEPLT